ncbi:MAG: FAD-dependent oxidoreductase, partial [Terrimicrobiaceae bacterium]
WNAAALRNRASRFEQSRQSDGFRVSDRASAAAAVPCRQQSSAFNLQSCGEESGPFRFATAFLRETQGILELANWSFPILGKFDVVVAGGGTGGAPAGIAAARAGANTLVLENQHGLGGVGTLGLINNYWFGNRVGFTAELDETVKHFDALSRSKDGQSWSPEVKSAIYHQMLQAAGGRAWTASFAFGVKMESGKVGGLLVSTPFGSGFVEAGGIIDATGNADVAAAAGAPCRVIDACHVAVQGAGISPRFHPNVRGQNSDHTFVDETDPVGITSAYVQARAKYPHAFDTAALVDTRERRQIVGDLELSPIDLLACRTFPDTVVTASSNFDTHGFTIHPVFMVAAPDHDPLQAHVPFRCMLPRGIDGVLVTGLGMSAHRDALPVIRMQADVQNQGYAAGLAVAESVAKKVSLRQLDIHELQGKLVALGILAPGVLEHQDSFPMSSESIREAADGDLGKLLNVAILFAHPEESRNALLAVMANDPTPQRRHDAALILGLMGVSEAASTLEEIVRCSSWDHGWNYCGMGQFGRSMSRLDAIIIALSRTRNPIGIEAIEEKILALDG